MSIAAAVLASACSVGAQAQQQDPASTTQPRMEAALKALESARSDLEASAHNKGGHRVKAIELVDQAISQVKEGIQYARAHPEESKVQQDEARLKQDQQRLQKDEAAAHKQK
jgi:hypothetical protein